MPTVEQSVFIARPVQAVWDFVHTAPNWPSWESSALECNQVTDGPPGVGTRWVGAARVLGRRMDWATEFTEYDPLTLSVSKSIEGVMCFTATRKFEAVDGGTLFTYRVDSESGLGGVFGKIADPFIAKVFSRTLRASLDNLADLLATRELSAGK